MCCRDDPVVVGHLNVNIHVSGWTTDPRLTLYFKPATAAAKTLNVAILDSNGVVVSDTYVYNIPSGTSSLTLYLGDFINAQRTAKSLPVGQYFILIKIVEDNQVFTQGIFLCSAATSIPYDPDNEYLDHIAIIDKVTGFLLKLPPTLNLVPTDDRYLVFLYYHKNGKGRLVKMLGPLIELDTGYHKFVKLKITIKFNTTKDLLYYMYARAWGIPSSVAIRLVDLIEEGSYSDAVKLLEPMYTGILYPLGRAMIEVDTANAEIREHAYIYLGQIDWGKVFGWGAIGCGAAVAAAVILTTVTAGAGAVSLPIIAAACLAGAAVGAGIAVVTSDTSKGVSRIREEARATVDEAKKAVEEKHSEAQELLTQWLQQGKITQSDFNKMMDLLNKMKEASFTSLDELLKDVDDAYKEGYKEGVGESKKWIALSGVGGAVIGFILGRR